MKNLFFASCFVAGVALLAGCGGGDANLPDTVDAAGVVTLDGQPLDNASIVLAPVEAGEGKYPAYGSSDEDGGFELKAFEAKDGAVPGSYKVRVVRSIPVTAGGDPIDLGEDSEHASEGDDSDIDYKNDLPEPYADFNNSGLTLEIPEDGSSDLKIELVSNP